MRGALGASSALRDRPSMNTLAKMTEAAKSAPELDKRPRIPTRVRQAVDALIAGKVRTQKAAAELVGLSPEHLCRMIKKPMVQAFIAQRTRETIVNSQMIAAATLVRLLDGESEHVQKDVALRILEIAGIKPSDTPGVSITLNTPGYVIDLSASPQIAHQAHEPANPMIDLAPVPDDLRGTRFEDVHPVNSDEGDADE